MKGLGIVLGFVFGGMIGGAVGYTMAKDKYLKTADEEIASMKKYYEDMANKAIKDAEEAQKKAAEATDNADLYMKNMEKMAAANYILRNERESSDEDKEDDLKTLQNLVKKNGYR